MKEGDFCEGTRQSENNSVVSYLVRPRLPKFWLLHFVGILNTTALYPHDSAIFRNTPSPGGEVLTPGTRRGTKRSNEYDTRFMYCPVTLPYHILPSPTASRYVSTPPGSNIRKGHTAVNLVGCALNSLGRYRDSVVEPLLPHVTRRSDTRTKVSTS